MPESRIRKKAAYTPPAAKGSGIRRPSPRWFAPLMVGLLLIGLAWIVTYYVSQGKAPVPGIHDFNLLVGFGILLVGFMMTTRWR
jgi:cell division protein CrgA